MRMALESSQPGVECFLQNRPSVFFSRINGGQPRHTPLESGAFPHHILIQHARNAGLVRILKRYDVLDPGFQHLHPWQNVSSGSCVFSATLVEGALPNRSSSS